MAQFKLSVKSTADIKSIAKYTAKNFGAQQSLKYAEKLEERLSMLSQQPSLGRSYIAINDKMLLRYRFMAHMIFYYEIDEGIHIVRILGGSMDFDRHLN